MTQPDSSRRLFLRQAGALGSLVGASATPLALNLLAAGSAAAQSAADYKALVCVFLFGGNDAYNTVLATDADSWASYRGVRDQGSDPIALPAAGTAPNPGASIASVARLGGVLPISPRNPQGRSFALHPALGSLATLFDRDRRLAILPNIGPLVMPTTKAQVAQAGHPKPPSLYSHNDQQSIWQALAPEGASRGWGGRFGDLLASMNGRPVFTAISASGNAVWLAGDTVRQYQVDTNGAIRVGADGNGRVYGSAPVAAAMERVLTTSRGDHVFERDLAALGRRTIEAEAALRSVLRPASSAPFGTTPVSGGYNARTDPLLQHDSLEGGGGKAFNPLAQQLQMVARMIDAGASSGLAARRQVFFVGLGSFDHHSSQVRAQAELLAQLAHGLAYFDATLGALGLRERVVSFTASDFGRTFTSNGDGTDHGWGAHHFVLGGAVRGGDLYGRFPLLGLKNAHNNQFDSSPDQLGNGALLPQTSVEQLGATLGRWFGLNDGQLLDVFPNLARFDAGRRNLGFLG